MLKFASFGFLVFSSLAPSTAHADPVVLGQHLLAADLGRIENSIQFGLPGVFFWGFPTVGADLFGVSITADDVGRTFRSTADNDPNFALAASTLTNGVTDPVQSSLRFADGVNLLSDDFEGFPPSFTMIPQPGDTITAISFRLDRFLLSEGIEDIDGIGFRFRRVLYQGLISIEGTRPGGTPGPTPAPVPEPATIALVVSGLGLAALRSRRWRRSAT